MTTSIIPGIIGNMHVYVSLSQNTKRRHTILPDCITIREKEWHQPLSLSPHVSQLAIMHLTSCSSIATPNHLRVVTKRWRISWRDTHYWLAAWESESHVSLCWEWFSHVHSSLWLNETNVRKRKALSAFNCRNQQASVHDDHEKSGRRGLHWHHPSKKNSFL